MGLTIYAGHALAMRVLGLAYVPLSGLATAVAILIGQSLGAARPHLARTGGYLALRYCVAVSVFSRKHVSGTGNEKSSNLQ
ncbi:MAG: hypothetical protein E3J50_02290 [Dehalococcoidia bacterium]|nr:MAG: hypothetical protein E3J50_02290 [Dehalococcoidia bacterium]